MGTLNRKVIHCPVSCDHPKKKILLLFGQNEINVYCREHSWLKIELTQNGKPINFENVVAKITDMDKNTFFDLDPIPTISIGEFKNKKDSKCRT